MSRQSWYAIGTVAVLVFCLYVSLAQLLPESPLPASVSQDGRFSAVEARGYLDWLAASPHPTGSERQAELRDYLVTSLRSFGYEVEVQHTLSVTAEKGVVGTVDNVIAIRRGTPSTGAVLLMSHYDSLPVTAGAADNCSGAAAALEIAKTMALAFPQPTNDYIILFTDGEEQGLLGAAAFVERHPWLADVRAVVNLDAVSVGPVSPVQVTSPANWMLTRYAHAGHAVGSSAITAVRGLLPLNDDLVSFGEANVPGITLSGLYLHPGWHTSLDTSKSVSDRALQQMGDQALGLFKELIRADLSAISGDDSVFFSLWRGGLVHYSRAWVMPLAVFSGLALAALLGCGISMRRITPKGFALGFAASLGSLVGVTALSTLLWWFFRQLAVGRPLSPHTRLDGLMLVGYLLIAALLYHYGQRRMASALETIAGAQFLWVATSIGSAVVLPGSSYLFTWPALAGDLLMAYMLFLAPRLTAVRSLGDTLAFGLASLPALVLVAPVIVMAFLAAGALAIPAAVGLWGLVLMATLPLLHRLPRLRFRGGIGIPAAVALLLIVVGACFTGASRTTPIVDAAVYYRNGDNGSAVWMVPAVIADSWQRQLFPQRPSVLAMARVLPLGGAAKVSAGPAVPESVGIPQLELVDDQKGADQRNVRVRVKSTRDASVLYISYPAGAPPIAINLDGDGIPLEAFRETGNHFGWRTLRYVGLPAKGIEMDLTVPAGQPVRLYLADETTGLPTVTGYELRPRPANITSSGDTTLAGGTYVIY